MAETQSVYSKLTSQKNSQNSEINPLCTIGTQDAYGHLNRYGNVLPGDDGLFLKGIKGYYQNANKYDFGEKTVVVSQAPVPNIFSNDPFGYFYYGLYAGGINAIFMLTSYLEKGVQKADVYIPENLNASIGSTFKVNDELYTFTITCKSIKMFLDEKLIARNLTMSVVKNSEFVTLMTVKHFHYTGWPDFGVPPIDDFKRLLAYSKEYATVQVHCSAGMGRAGVFALLEGLTHDPSVQNKRMELSEVGDYLLTLRHKRPGLVQSHEQFEFAWGVYKELMLESVNHQSCDTTSSGSLNTSLSSSGSEIVITKRSSADGNAIDLSINLSPQTEIVLEISTTDNGSLNLKVSGTLNRSNE